MKRLYHDDPKSQSFLEKVYTGSAIEYRHSVVGDYDRDPSEYEFYPKNEQLEPQPTTERRNELFAREANRISLDTCRRLFEQFSHVGPEDITHLITVTCTGFTAPGFDFYLARNLPLPEDVDKFQLGFMGCYAGFTALKLARSLCLAEPSARVLVVNVELCTLHFQKKSDSDTLVANAIFADGVSAALVSANKSDSGGPRLTLENFLSTHIPDSEEDMAWTIGQTGFDMRLSVYVPKIIKRNIRHVVEELLQRVEKSQKDVDIWAYHPGGRAILDRVAKELDLPQEAFTESYEVLRNYGNMSSATILFVLERLLRSEKRGTVFAAAFGPGLTVESGVMELSD